MTWEDIGWIFLAISAGVMVIMAIYAMLGVVISGVIMCIKALGGGV